MWQSAVVSTGDPRRRREGPGLPAAGEVEQQRLDNQFREIFEQLFESAPVSTGAVAVELVLTADELRSGVVKSIEIAHPGECTVCEPRACPLCEGRGVSEVRQGFFVVQRVCECAAGKVFDRHCPACAGSGATRDVVEVTVPAGSEAGQVIAIAGEGDRVDGGGRGELQVHLSVAGVDVPRATLHQPRSPHVIRFAIVLALVLGVAVLVSQLW